MSLVTTDGLGKDIKLPDNVRVYLISSTQHGPSDQASPTATCQQLSNPLPHDHAVRALYIALDEGATKGIKPPESETRKVGISMTLPQRRVGFPEIPGRTTPVGRRCFRQRHEHSAEHADSRKFYKVLVGDRTCGNDIPGVRHPDFEVARHSYGLGSAPRTFRRK